LLKRENAQKSLIPNAAPFSGETGRMLVAVGCEDDVKLICPCEACGIQVLSIGVVDYSGTLESQDIINCEHRTHGEYPHGYFGRGVWLELVTLL
jgi:hypothetical protein